MKILVLNAGSSSLKYSLFEMPAQRTLIAGNIERIGETASPHGYTLADGSHTSLGEQPVADHAAALDALFEILAATGLLTGAGELFCIGHRVVHGGERFRRPALIDAEVLAQIDANSPLAPLHNPANLLGIRATLRRLPSVPQVAVFDTAFHHTLPAYAYRYALPDGLYRAHGVRRYGFHGTSHGYVAGLAAAMLGKPLAETNLITLHLGNGASVAAIENGTSVDTSMGMTPLEGLMMGSRCGDLDPALPFYLGRQLGLDSAAVEAMLNRDSGLKGICGENDMRAVHQLAADGNADARLALEMYAYRIRKYIGAYLAVLGRVDALVFTGGIGEHDAWLRERCCQRLAGFGIVIDAERNGDPGPLPADVAPAGAAVAVLVIATREELAIAMQARDCVANR